MQYFSCNTSLHLFLVIAIIIVLLLIILIITLKILWRINRDAWKRAIGKSGS